MLNKKYSLSLILLCFLFETIYADPGGMGQTIQITTRLKSFVGKPSWLIEVRDLDHNQTIPYLYDIERGDNFWLIFTMGRNYLITASTLSFSPYSDWPFRTRKIHNFCHLESHCRIIRGKSLHVTIAGNLTPNTSQFSCHVNSFKDDYFTVVEIEPPSPPPVAAPSAPVGVVPTAVPVAVATPAGAPPNAPAVVATAPTPGPVVVASSPGGPPLVATATPGPVVVAPNAPVAVTTPAPVVVPSTPVPGSVVVTGPTP